MSSLKICTCGKLIPIAEKCECKIRDSRQRNKQRAKQYPDEKKFFNDSRWKRKRLYVIKRDGGCCQRCLIKVFIALSNKKPNHTNDDRNDSPECSRKSVNWHIV
jgi:5-methylcytosine-specific restriction endonuclease McrA